VGLDEISRAKGVYDIRIAVAPLLPCMMIFIKSHKIYVHDCTIIPMIPAPAALNLMSPKHDRRDFFAIATISMPTSCFEAS
jgi:hypothetical protein